MQNKAPVSSHPLFPIVVALWFAALFGLSSFAIRTSLLESLIISSQIDQYIPAAAPPLGQTARILVAIILAVIGAIVGGIFARIITRIGKKSSARPRKTKPNAPANEVADFDEIPVAPRSPAAFGQKNAVQAQSQYAQAPDQEPVRKRALSLDEHREAEEVEEDFAALPEAAPLPGMNGEIFDVSSCDFSNSAVIDTVPVAENALQQSATLSEPLELNSYAADAYLEPVSSDQPVPSQESSRIPFSLDEPEVIEMLEPIDLAAFNAEMGNSGQLKTSAYDQAAPSIQQSETTLRAAPIPMAYEPPQHDDVENIATDPFGDASFTVLQNTTNRFSQPFPDESADRDYVQESSTHDAFVAPSSAAPDSAPSISSPRIARFENPLSELDSPPNHSGSSAAADTWATLGQSANSEDLPLSDLNPQQLLERLSQAISQRSTASQAFSAAPKPAPTVPQAVPTTPQAIPVALRPINFSAYDEEDEDEAYDTGPFGYMPQRSIAFPSIAKPAPETEPAEAIHSPVSSKPAPIPQAYTPEEQVEPDVAEENYSSLLNVKRPTTQKTNFFRIEEPDYGEEEDSGFESEAVVIFPGQGPQNAPRFSAPSSFEQSGMAAKATDTAPQRFDGPQISAIGTGNKPVSAGTAFAAPSIDPEETERALRSALATLQRMTSAT